MPAQCAGIRGGVVISDVRDTAFLHSSRKENVAQSVPYARDYVIHTRDARRGYQSDTQKLEPADCDGFLPVDWMGI